jgi:hypothetical protein
MSHTDIELLHSLLGEIVKPTRSAARRRADNTSAVAKHRAAEQDRRDKGVVVYSKPNAREALADAAMHILATGGEGAEEIRSVLRAVFGGQVGAPLTIESHVKSGKIKSKFFNAS